jgi:uncharacterized membrane protein (UPF0127 family)
MQRQIRRFWQQGKTSALLGILGLSLFLIACSDLPNAVSREAQPTPTQPMEANLGQSLPITAEVKIADRRIQLEVARTIEQQATGLMYRRSLAADRGMLFPFGQARRVSFWMKNVAIPLDMVFLQAGQVKAIAANVPPCTTDPCPTYGADEAVDQVLELRGGRAAELGLKVGDRLAIEFKSP